MTVHICCMLFLSVPAGNVQFSLFKKKGKLAGIETSKLCYFIAVQTVVYKINKKTSLLQPLTDVHNFLCTAGT